jgi:hypothetical protein
LLIFGLMEFFTFFEKLILCKKFFWLISVKVLPREVGCILIPRTFAHINLESLEFDNIDEGRSNFRKVACQVAEEALGRKVGSVAKNSSEDAWFRIKKTQLDGMIVRYCIDVLRKWEEVVGSDLLNSIPVNTWMEPKSIIKKVI